MQYIFAFLIFIHGVIHILGFVKAYQLAPVNQLRSEITKSSGAVWLFVAVGFVILSILYISKFDLWFALAFLFILISQILITSTWQDAKFGTVANIIVLLIAIVGYGQWDFKNSYNEDVTAVQSDITITETESVTERDIEHLPAPVQNYLRYVGVVGKPKVLNAKIKLEGEMRQWESDWFRFNSEQYNFYQNPARFFLMTARINGFQTIGYHSYKKNKAKMLIKLLSLFPVASEDGEKLFQAETVTIFNDMCLLVPATLIDQSIEWESIDDFTVNARFTNQNTTISATLLFNEKYQLINFISEDRFAITNDGLKNYTFSTPVKGYKLISGYNLFSSAEAQWDYPEGKFTYGRFRISSIEMNT